MAAQRPEHAHATELPATTTFPTRPAHTAIGWLQDRRPVVSKRPLHSCDAAKMSPHICICPQPVLSDHVPSPPAAGSHCQAREVSAPHCGTEIPTDSETAYHLTLEETSPALENTDQASRARPGQTAGPPRDDPSFIVLTETKFSFRCIPVWDRYSPTLLPMRLDPNLQ